MKTILNKVFEAIKCFMATRANRISTFIGLVLLYLLINNRPELNSFITWLFHEPLRNLIEKIVGNEDFIDAIVAMVIGVLIGTKKF